MKDLLEKLKERLAHGETGKYLRFMALPLVVIVLVLVIVITDRPTKDNTLTSVHETESTKDAGDAPQTEADEETSSLSTQGLSKDAVPEIHQLMETYLKAKKTCDENTLSTVYGGTASAEQLGKRIARMEEEVKYYQDFQNLTCFTVPGLTDHSWVLYACFDIKFRQAESMAPTMTACYVKKAEDGTYYLEGETTEEEAGYIRKMNESEEVQKLAREVNTGLRTALESDANLLSVYKDLTGETEAETESVSADQSQEEESSQPAESQESAG